MFSCTKPSQLPCLHARTLLSHAARPALTPDMVQVLRDECTQLLDHITSEEEDLVTTYGCVIGTLPGGRPQTVPWTRLTWSWHPHGRRAHQLRLHGPDAKRGHGVRHRVRPCAHRVSGRARVGAPGRRRPVCAHRTRTASRRRTLAPGNAEGPATFFLRFTFMLTLPSTAVHDAQFNEQYIVKPPAAGLRGAFQWHQVR